jgi:hypothetical protein
MKGVHMSNNLVNVAVPEQHLTLVYRYIADLEASGGATAVASAPAAAPAEPENQEWTPARIRKMVEQSPPAMRDLLKVLATHPGEWLDTEKLAKAIQGKDADPGTVAGTLGAFSRRLKSRYGIDSMPYEGRYEHGVGRVLRMSKDMAQQILQAMKNGN